MSISVRNISTINALICIIVSNASKIVIGQTRGLTHKILVSINLALITCSLVAISITF